MIKIRLDIWKKIFGVISKTPGIELYQIVRKLEISTSLIKRYLSFMEEHNHILVLRKDNRELYFVGSGKLQPGKEIQSEGTRIQIYFTISRDPGLHLSKIANLLKMSPELAEYHLVYLEKNNFIKGAKDEKGYYKRYYVVEDVISIEDKEILNLLRQETLLKIVLYIFKHGRLQNKELANKLRISPSTLSYHISKLLEYNIVNVSSFGEEKGYSLKNEKQIISLIRRYKLTRLIEGFADTWKDFYLK